MGKARLFRIVPCGPSRDVVEMKHSTIRRLRSGDYRAMAVVLVHQDGTVETAHAGERDGHFFRLSGGLTECLQRLHKA